ncbi:MAG: hypothetical protein H7281_06210 [Bacteriovorax sp.]|nr:hypothetical protein [Bacteriovorax sp.]
MRNLNKHLLLLSLLFLLSCQSILKRNVASNFHISNNTKQLVTWETKANAVSNRSNEVIRVEHYEIPLRLLEQDIDESLDSEVKKSLIFTKNGEQYLRWLINPEDSKWHLEVKAFLQKNNLDSEPKIFFDGYLTASRSMIIVNPTNGASFSLKVSTNKTGGKWTDKKQTWKDAQQVRKMNKYLQDILPNMETESLVIMDEPGAWGIKELDHGMIMRSLNDLPSDGHYYLPAFSVLHEEEGVRIAKLNGSTDVAKYWDKHFNQPLAQAMAEYFAITGAWYDSPHAQNFLVELDRDMKPTGKIVLRDLGDSYLLDDFVKNTKFAAMTKNWEEGKVLTGKMITSIGLLHGNSPPSWLTAMEYKEYGWNFYIEFEKRFSKISNIPVHELTMTNMKQLLFDYSIKSYNTTTDSWQKFLHFANCMNGEAKTLKGESCPEFYLKKQKKIQCFQGINAIIN